MIAVPGDAEEVTKVAARDRVPVVDGSFGGAAWLRRWPTSTSRSSPNSTAHGPSGR